MAPQAPPQQSPPTNHARTSSFFSFRSKPAAPLTHQRTSSMGNLNVDNPSLSQRGVAPQQPPMQQQPMPQYQQQPQPHTTVPPTNSPPIPAGQKNTQLPPQAPTLHPEIRSIVNLVTAHAHKVYFSGPLVRRIERQPDGSRPPPKDEGWSEVWAQLGGTTLSIWSAKQIQEASKQGKQVPPTYINTTDAVSVISVP
jgi:CCR4-NOT transcriptional complex subunit CAF120